MITVSIWERFVRDEHDRRARERLAWARHPSYAEVMRECIQVTRTMKASVETVWKVLSAGDQVERWFEWVRETCVHDAAEGGLRLIVMQDGTSFDEYITLNHVPSHTYQYYAPHPPLPVAHVLGTYRLESLPDGRTQVLWYVSFDRLADAPAAIGETMRALYLQALERIDALTAETPEP